MGVPQIWELLRPYLKDKRVPLRKFAADFKSKNGTPVRIAIDGYTWLFECGFFGTQSSTEKFVGQGQISKAVVNFIHRLKEFLSLDINFILVFDGKMKPWFKRNYKNSDEETNTTAGYSNTWQEHLRIHRELNTCLNGSTASDSEEYMRVVKFILDTLRISYIEACGEGEAQCAWLQKNGYVDYALSNDSDTLIFGSTKMLRNYSKAFEDFGVTGVGAHRPDVLSDSKESFVTVVELEDIRNLTEDRYEWWTLLFFSILLGADYNEGIKGLGRAKSAKLAQLREPDFAKKFHMIFGTIENPFEPAARETKYKEFQKDLLQYCSQNSVELFGRNYRALLSKENMEGWPSETAVMYYFHPYLIPDLNHCIFDRKYVNMSENSDFKAIDFVKLEEFLRDIHLSGVTHFKRWYKETVHESFVLRHLLNDDLISQNDLRITEEKTFMSRDDRFQYSCWRVRYNDFLTLHSNDESHFEKAPNSLHKRTTKRRAETLHYKYNIWVPKGLVPDSHPLVKQYNEEIKVRSKASPKRSPKRSPQKNTLDAFLSAHSSPLFGTTSTTSQRLPALEPVKRRLFVETEIEDDDDSDNEEGDSSLIILSESKVSNFQRSPASKAYWDLTVDEEQDDDESPLKKQRTNAEGQPADASGKSDNVEAL